MCKIDSTDLSKESSKAMLIKLLQGNKDEGQKCKFVI